MVKETILTCDDYFDSLLKDIDKAEETIDLETYIFNDDELGVKVCSALIKASKRNVKVRLLVDGVGTPDWVKCFEKMEEAGIKLRVYRPYPWKIWQLKHSTNRSNFLSQLTTLILNLNSRNHRKTCIIDNNIVYVGSANIIKNGEGWRDCIVRLEKVDVSEIAYAFNIAWKGFSIKERIHKRFQKIDLNPIFSLNYTRRLRRKLYKTILQKIRNATTKVYVTSAYFNPNYFLLRAFAQAAKRGVDIKLILPQTSDVTFMPWVARTFYTQLLKSGVEIYEYKPTILHSKILIIDDWYCLGSSNLNHRSLHHDLEIDVKLQTPNAKKELEKFFLEDIQNSKKITLANLKKQPWYVSIFGRILLFLRYYL